ncbi:MAG: dihydropteroate synthase [candidate division WOR-3 bacterium]
MRALIITNGNDFLKELKRIGCDERAFPIFQKKTEIIPIKVDSLSSASANILKQTALSLGADCVIHQDVIRGRKKISSGIILATPRQYETFTLKLSSQYATLKNLSEEIKDLLAINQKSAFIFRFCHQVYHLEKRVHIMGILNLTPDSFYDGGRYLKPDEALRQAEKMAEEGADFIDIGAESTRPGSKPISAKEEIARLKPILSLIKKKLKIPISCDTYKSAVADFALKEGCEIINDISALRFDKKMAKLLAEKNAYCILMHIKGRPQTMQKNPKYEDLMGEIYHYLKERIAFAQKEGIKGEKIIVDPGIGFGKRLDDNYEIIRRLKELRGLGKPILLGPSRKSFIGLTLNLPVEERLEGSLAACVLALINGANILRVHDVKETKRAVKMAEAIIKGGKGV